MRALLRAYIRRADQPLAFGALDVEGHDTPAAVEAQRRAYHRHQSGDPAKLGEALVPLAAMESPLKQLFDGSDAVSNVTADRARGVPRWRRITRYPFLTDGRF